MKKRKRKKSHSVYCELEENKTIISEKSQGFIIIIQEMSEAGLKNEVTIDRESE